MRVMEYADRIVTEIPKAEPGLVEAFRVHDVAKISDSMAKYGTFRSDVKPLGDEMRICGPCVTLQCEGGDFEAGLRAAEYVHEGEVLVIDAGGFRAFAVCGAELAERLKEKKAGGLVVYGAVRDRMRLLEIGLPVFALGTSARKGCFSGPVSVNMPVNGAGLVVYPGDLIVGDSDGVVAVPWYDLKRVLGLTEAKLAHELSNQKKINEGAVMTVLYGCEEKLARWREPKEA